MISIYGIIIATLAIGLVAVILLSVIRLLQSEATSSITTVAVSLNLVILVM